MSTDAKWAQVSQGLGNVSEKARLLAREVCEAAWWNQHDVWFLWGDGNEMDHVLNRSGKIVIDFMVHTKPALYFVRDYLWVHRARHGLQHVIADRKITSTVVQPGVVRQMSDRGNPTANHEDHVHSQHYGGGYVPLTPGTPAPSKPVVEVPKFLDVTGQLDKPTVSKWQSVMGTPVDGVISKPDSKLIRAVQARLKGTVDWRIVVDGDMGPKTIAGLQRYLKTPVDGFISIPKSQMVIALQRRLNENRF